MGLTEMVNVRGVRLAYTSIVAIQVFLKRESRPGKRAVQLGSRQAVLSKI
jgi:hypothetical protein